MLGTLVRIERETREDQTQLALLISRKRLRPTLPLRYQLGRPVSLESSRETIRGVFGSIVLFMTSFLLLKKR